MADMVTYRAPRETTKPRTVSPKARRAMEEAALALTEAVPALVGEEALAERERLRREDGVRESAQRELDVGGKSWA